MPLISRDQIVGKTLIAKKRIPLYPSAKEDKNRIIAIVEPGKPVGVVYSWVDGERGKPLFWMFYAKVGNIEKAYYAKHDENGFNLPALKEQGVKTTQEEIQEEENKDKPTSEKIFEYIKKYAMWAGIGLAGILVFREILRKK